MGANLSHFRIINESYATPENVLMIVGTALDGPSGVPFQLYPDKDPYQVLGIHLWQMLMLRQLGQEQTMLWLIVLMEFMQQLF